MVRFEGWLLVMRRMASSIVFVLPPQHSTYQV